jgi:hypothetical protein
MKVSDSDSDELEATTKLDKIARDSSKAMAAELKEGRKKEKEKEKS